MDSAVLLHYAVRRLGHGPVYALSFHYGQKHRRELEMARWQAAVVPEVVEHKVVRVGSLGELVGGASTLIDGGPDVPALGEIPAADRDQPPTYVPNRNMVLLSLAACFAESRECPLVLYGAQAHDEYGYWDCTPEFVARLNAALALNRRNPVTVAAPFAQMRKSEEVALGLELGVDFAHTWSCYRGREVPCGTCPTCVERANAFAEAGVPDPLREAIRNG
jgi:7-cyano-7-deazaguanine synthase